MLGHITNYCSRRKSTIYIPKVEMVLINSQPGLPKPLKWTKNGQDWSSKS